MSVLLHDNSGRRAAAVRRRAEAEPCPASALRTLVEELGRQQRAHAGRHAALAWTDERAGRDARP